ncbi:DUF4189 domain-containing protein [Ottowia testudinis]|uniref:DUF4189 domain-containing protein n=1 Tax=Ottowia testudinis TaxID=2816950 RepID=A0A975CI94_9BURK|nr:DUF4189 domain-containing protein [Ottowia testudinis]QTD44684.1 DUF4189 domain-containing protein [Ottowia testudinis]
MHQQQQEQVMEQQRMAERQARERAGAPAAPSAASNYVTRYGALAVSEDGQTYGLLTSLEGGMLSPMPQSGAIEACEKVRPSKSRCKAVNTFHNRCLAITWSKKTRQAFWFEAGGWDAAQKGALRQCNQAAGDCIEVDWNCATPGDGGQTSINADFFYRKLMVVRAIAVDAALKTIFISPDTETEDEAKILARAGYFPVAFAPGVSAAEAKALLSHGPQQNNALMSFSSTCAAVAVPDRGIKSHKDFFFGKDPELPRARRNALDNCNQVHGKKACSYFRLSQAESCAGPYAPDADLK